MVTRRGFAFGAALFTLLGLAVSWYRIRRRNAGTIYDPARVLSSPSSSWKRVGSVKEIWYYPLKSGQCKPVEECTFDKFGITVNVGDLIMKDRMFVAYDEIAGGVLTAGAYPKLLLVNVSLISQNQARLDMDGRPSLVFDLPKANDKNVKTVKCSKWFKDPTQCLDCGNAASEWLSRSLINSDLGIRLGTFSSDEGKNFARRLLDKYVRLYSEFRNEDRGLFQNLTSYMILSEASVDNLNLRLKKPILPRQLRPNVVVDGCEPFAEDNWEWIKFGEKTIIRKVALCTRCTMIRIDPLTGIPDPDFEPYATLRRYRKLPDSDLCSLASHAPAIGVYCGLIRGGKVKLGDGVFVFENNRRQIFNLDNFNI